MQTLCQNEDARITRCRYTGKKQKEKSSSRTGYTAYRGIDDFLRSYPVAVLDRFGDRVISGCRIC